MTSPPTDPSAELKLLQVKYQQLLKEKERVETQYQADSTKWKEFRSWVLSGPPQTSEAAPSDERASYAKYKGRGRYAQELADGNDTINARYRVDPARNAGATFAFDEVVRDKCTRQHLEAEDCECCRNYYDAMPANPDRSRQPVWRSPPKTPTKRRRAESHNISPSHNRHEVAKKNRQKEISKHRQRWVTPNTPPKYWEIGFPTTQDVSDINKEADDMNKRKRRDIDYQARHGGAYVKRDGS